VFVVLYQKTQAKKENMGGIISGILSGKSQEEIQADLEKQAAAKAEEVKQAAKKAAGLDNAYLEDSNAVRNATTIEAEYFDALNTFSRVTYKNPDLEKKIANIDTMKTYLTANGLDSACASIKIYDVESTRAVTADVELKHPDWEGLKKCHVVAFRGTTIQDAAGNYILQDVIHDLASAFLSDFKDCNGVLLGKAGMGFITAYDKLRNSTEMKFLDDIKTAAEACPGGLIVTGHSLGGALATLCAVDFLLSGKVKNPKLITFGAPRPFPPSLAHKVTDTVGFENIRIVNAGDPIPLLPPSVLGMYRHSGKAFFHNSKGNGTWSLMDHDDFHGEFPEIMERIKVWMEEDAANAAVAIIDAIIHLDPECHNLVHYGNKLKEMFGAPATD
jgi:hypothetical protein